MSKHNETIEEMTMDAAIELAEQEEAEESRRRIHWIDAGLLTPHPDNPRKELGDLTEMAESIKAKGLLQNLTVVDCSKMDTTTRMLCRAPAYGYMVVIGHRRLAAAKLAGLTELPCAVVPMDYQEMLTTMLTENVQRVDLNPYEQAQGFRQLSMELGMSVSEISERTGFGETTVRRRLKLGTLNQDRLRALSDKAAKEGTQISLAVLEEVADLEDEGDRNSVLSCVGTDNYRQRLQNAQQKQRENAERNEWRRLLAERGFRELPDSIKYGSEWIYVQRFYSNASKGKADEALRLVQEQAERQGYTDVEPGFYFDWGASMYLKFRGTKVAQPEPEKDADDEEREGSEAVAEAPVQTGPTEEELRRAACDRLRAAFENAYELRRTFIEGQSELTAKRALPAMVDLFVRMTELDATTGELYDEEAAAIRRRLENKPTAAAVYLIYAQFADDKGRHCYGLSAYDEGEYLSEDSDLDYLCVLYEGLVAAGYGMSDMEKALLDGTSPLYYHEGYSLDEPEEGGEPDAAQPAKTRFEVYQAMTDDELAAEIGDIDNYYGELAEAIRFEETPEDVARKVEYFCCPYEAAVDEKEDAEEIRRAKCALHGDVCGRCIAAWLNEPYGKEKNEE